MITIHFSLSKSIPATTKVRSNLVDNLGRAAFQDGVRSREATMVGMYHSQIDVQTEDRLVQGFTSGVV